MEADDSKTGKSRNFVKLGQQWLNGFTVTEVTPPDTISVVSPDGQSASLGWKKSITFTLKSEE